MQFFESSFLPVNNHSLTKNIQHPYLILLLLLLPLFSNGQDGYRQVSSLENYINSLVERVRNDCNTTDNLTPDDLSQLPIGITPNSCNGSTTIIVVDSAYRRESGGWFLSVYASVILPGSTYPIAFAGKNIAFNEGGFIESSSSKLTLVTTIPITISDQIRLELPADGHNYIEFDCDGFRAINLKGDFVFDEGLLKPDNELTDDPTVRASFEVNSKDLNNILMAVNITPFKIKGLDDLSFQVTNAVADFSDIINPPGFSLPQEYQQMLGPDILLWRGFYLQDLTVRLKNMADNPAKDPAISAHNLLVDELGVTGLFSATNLMSLADGTAGGWPLSIDRFTINLKFNKVAGGSLAGNLNIPFLGKEPVPYTAIVEQEDESVNYLFSVTTTDDKVYDAPFSAKIRIDKGSIIALEKRDGKFNGSARLQGMLTVDHQISKFEGIKFQDLSLTTQKPYLIGGVFSTVSSGKSEGVGFPLSIDSISLMVFQGEAAISISTSLNLMDDKGFSASTTVQLIAKVEETIVPVSGNSDNPDVPPVVRHEWKFERVKINEIAISSESSAIYLKGRLGVYDNDPVYGTGFGGDLAFKINSLMKDPVKVTAYFGSMPTFRYWHLDAYVPTSIPLGPVVTIKGLQGGASYHMRRQQSFQPDFTKIDPEEMIKNGPTDKSIFIPDEGTGMGFMAGITLVVSNDAAVNADALFEVAFNNNGGLRYAQFTGTAFFFTPTANRERTNGGKVPSAPVFANLNMLYDNDNKVFHANLKTYLNVAGFLKGTGPNNLVGEAVIHTDPKDWYIYIGRPSQMFGVTIAGLATAQTYFMIGTKVENIPLPPPEVREIFNDIDKGLMRDASALSTGRGFATGAHFRVGFDKRIRPFYVVVNVGAGADIMLRNYGDAHCEGRSGKIGVDGWYASGQAYVFLKGKVGIRVKGNDFDIVSVGAAALLQAKLPNPTWLKGQLGGKYRILGGLVKGRFKIKLVIGDQCEIVQEGSELDNIKVIADVKPDDTSEDVNVFTAPQVSFNTSIDTEFSMIDANDKLNYYRVKLSEFSVSKDGIPLAGNIEWNSPKDVAILRTHEILPPQSTLKMLVKLYWEKKPSGGSWETIKKDGQVAYEVRESNFTTGTAPDFIPDENVAYSYPVKLQYNLYPEQSKAGYVKLRMGQAYLFESSPDGTEYEFIAKFESSHGQRAEVPLTYNVSQANATFEIPVSIERQTVYKLSFVKRPVGAQSIDENLQRNEVSVSSDEDNEMTLASNTLEGTISSDAEKDLYNSAFRTSQFGRFEEKMASMTNARDLFDIAIGNIAVIGKRGDLQETFDEIELRGKEGQTDPLVQVIASPENQWMKQYISPILYDQYPVDKDVSLSWRDPEVLGVKPLKGVRLTNDLGDYSLTDANVTTGSAPARSGSFVVGYYLSFYGFRDYNDLRNQAAAKYLGNWSAAPQPVKNLLSAAGFMDLLEGEYPVEISYVLPGTTQPVFKQQLSIKY